MSGVMDWLRDEKNRAILSWLGGGIVGVGGIVVVAGGLWTGTLASSLNAHRQWELLEAQADELFKQGHEFGDNDALKEAIDVFRRALALVPRAEKPLDWARTQNNLGNALRILGERESGTARLEEAVTAFRSALEERTRTRVPLQWATTQVNLGNALRSLGERESGTARLEEAVAAFRAALEERTRTRVPLQWAMTQMNLGNALQTLGARESGTARLEEAVAAYRAALEECTHDRVPLDWAMTTGNQGVALMLLAERRSDARKAKQALELIEAAFTTSRDGGHAPNAADYEAQLPKARALVARLSNAGKKKASAKR